MSCGNLRPTPLPKRGLTRRGAGLCIAAVARLTSLVACTEAAISPDLSAEDLVLEAKPPAAEVALPAGLRLRVGTWNLHGGGDGSPQDIGAALLALRLDVVGLQECPEDLATAVALAGGFEHHVWADGRALLAHAPLSDPTHHPFAAGRAVLHANLQHGGATFSVYDAHIGWNAEGDLQAKELTETLLEPDTNPYLVMMGDFNDEHYSSQIQIIEARLQEAMFTAGLFPERISWPASGFDGSEGSQLIDLIFFSPALRPVVVAADVVNLAPVLSDHKPTWAELLFPSPAAPPFDTDPFTELRDAQAVLPPPSTRPPNLLTNPGAEDGLTGWTAQGGFVAADQRDHQDPRSGQGLFTGFSRPGRRAYAYAEQAVDLGAYATLIDEGRAELLLEGFMATGYDVRTSSGAVSNSPRPYDDAETTVRLLGASGEFMGEWSSGRRGTLGWHPFATATPLPPGTRQAQVRLHAHHKASAGVSNDGVFDDLYLGVGALEQAHPRLGADLLHDGGFESGGTEAFDSTLWRALEDQEALGIMAYPPWTASGRWCLVTGLAPEGPASQAVLRQDLDLSEHAQAQGAGELAVRWGGRLRTLDGRGQVELKLEVLDKDGTVFATLSAGAQAFAEWTHFEALSWIPPGASGARLVVQGDLPRAGTALFADALYAWPERTGAAASK